MFLGRPTNLWPIAVLPSVGAMERIDPRLLEAAADPHPSPCRRFTRMLMALITPTMPRP
ncbi:hypothetical protein [Cyanobium sp. Morenito 9A2]|uniref:hypothetical protein n=1 Tax=Cyanobium sp. Morenito 9A2 TaxID=2823718 RepID=UPI0020CE1B9A|nr:hypothetical protein [Cyanobium sp. Morenito 9A2]